MGVTKMCLQSTHLPAHTLPATQENELYGDQRAPWPLQIEKRVACNRETTVHSPGGGAEVVDADESSFKPAAPKGEKSGS